MERGVRMRQLENGQARFVVATSGLVRIGKVLTPEILLGQMPLQVAGVMKHPHDIDHVFAAAAVDQKMPGLLDNAQVAAGPVAAEKQVVGPGPTG